MVRLAMSGPEQTRERAQRNRDDGSPRERIKGIAIAGASHYDAKVGRGIVLDGGHRGVDAILPLGRERSVQFFTLSLSPTSRSASAAEGSTAARKAATASSRRRSSAEPAIRIPAIAAAPLKLLT